MGPLGLPSQVATCEAPNVVRRPTGLIRLDDCTGSSAGLSAEPQGMKEPAFRKGSADDLSETASTTAESAESDVDDQDDADLRVSLSKVSGNDFHVKVRERSAQRQGSTGCFSFGLWCLSVGLW